MAKADIKYAGEAPSARLVREADIRSTVEDALGRKIIVRKLSPLDRMRMNKAAGPDNSLNNPYMLYALVAYSTVSVDGDELLIPQNEIHLEAHIGRLGKEGYDAALDEVLKFYRKAEEAEVVEAAKK